MRKALTTAIAILATAAAFGGAASAALNWEGQNGIFLNPLAYPVAAGKTEAAAHFIDVDSAGDVKTYSVAHGLKGGVEIGYTRIDANVSGVKDQNLVHAKWQFLPETPESPAVAAWALYRDQVSGKSSPDFGVSATKAIPVGGKTVVVDVGLRSTKAVGHGLFGYHGSRKIKAEGSVAVFVTPKLAVGAEFRQQPGTRTWTDFAARYIVNDSLNIDAGIANLGPGINNQLALGVTYAW